MTGFTSGAPLILVDIASGYMIARSSSKLTSLIHPLQSSHLDISILRPDPNGILEFLITELAAAEKAGQRAWIFGHIPPGSSDVVRDQVRSFFFLSMLSEKLLNLTDD